MYVSLNIGSNDIKVLSLQGRKVKKWGSAAVPAGAVRDGAILQPQAVGEVIDGLFKSLKLPRDKVAVGVAGMSFTYRFINLPRVKQTAAEESILRAAKKEISLPLEGLYLTWQPVAGDGAEQTYFLLGVPRNLVDAVTETLKAAGVPLYLLDLRPLALARTALRENAIIVNMDRDSYDTVFIIDGRPAVIHTINPRGEEAVLEDNIRLLANELTKTAAFHQSGHPATQIDRDTPLLLAGELAAEPQTTALLQSQIEYPVAVLMPPLEYPETMPAGSYVTNIGLALKRTPLAALQGREPVHFTDLNVNILAGKYRKPKAKPVPAAYAWMAVFLAVALIALWPLYQAHRDLLNDNSRLQANLANVQQELNLAVVQDQAATQTKDAISTMLEATRQIRAGEAALLETRGDYSANLQQVTVVLPAGVTYTGIQISPKAITVRGEADNVFSVVAYAAALDGLGVYKTVRIGAMDDAVPPAGQSETGNISYEINIER